MCVLYPIPFSILFLSMFLVHLIVNWLLLVISWLLDLITTRILFLVVIKSNNHEITSSSQLNYTHWLKNCFWLNNMYVLTGN
jgi:Mg2+/Co2+ transporter CorB